MSDDTNKQKVQALQEHFGRRVVGDARAVIDQWYQLPVLHWTSSWLAGLHSRVERLDKSAERYGRSDLSSAAKALLDILVHCDNRSAPSSEQLSALAEAIGVLSQSAMRQNDQDTPGQWAFVQREVYVAISDPVVAEELKGQLMSFGIKAEVTADLDALNQARAHRRPLAVIIELDFQGPDTGLDIVADVQADCGERLPVVFYHPDPPDMARRLKAVRVGSKAFITRDSGLMRLIERLERVSRSAVLDLYRVLIVDDSRTQALHASQILNSVGMITRALSEPLALLETIDEFRPDIILMDMYMPDCNGVELATVMRQQRQYDRLPIIFLSSEEDVSKQMHAMAEGGDDFLTKPVHPKILAATVQHRCKRNQAIRNWMERDSLTGLYDHSHLLQRLQQVINQAERQGTPLAFVMLDLDKFKAVNDTWGHAVGDRVLRNLALLLRQRLRKTDIIGRYGGEEFGVVMPETHPADAKAVMESVLQSFQAIRHPVLNENDDTIRCSFSGGIAGWQPGETGSELAIRVDRALYVAKENGRSRLECAPEDEAG